MKTLYAIILTISLGVLYGQVGTGLMTHKITIWRFIEQTEHGRISKMIVFNNTDSALTLTLKQGPLSKISDRIIVKSKELTPENHEIFQLPIPGDYDEYLSFHLNGEKVGLLDAYLPLPPKDLKPKKYFSNEGLNGRGDELWISRNQLISRGTDTTVLHLNYFDKPVWNKDGFQTIELFNLTKSFDLKVVSPTKPIEEKSTRERYLLKLHFDKESNSNTRSDILVIYRPTTKTYELGINAEYGVHLIKNQEYERVNYRSNPFEIPILIKN